MNKRHSANAQEGFSLIESLISLLTFMAISLSIVPLFSKSMANNDSGNGYLQSTNYARGVLEELKDLPFDSPRLTIPVGQTSLVTDEYYSVSSHTWQTGTPPLGDDLWTRTTTVRQFASQDWDDDGELNDPLDGGASLDFVHLKEITVSVASVREGGPLGTGKLITLRHLKTF